MLHLVIHNNALHRLHVKQSRRDRREMLLVFIPRLLLPSHQVLLKTKSTQCFGRRVQSNEHNYCIHVEKDSESESKPVFSATNLTCKKEDPRHNPLKIQYNSKMSKKSKLFQQLWGVYVNCFHWNQCLIVAGLSHSPCSSLSSITDDSGTVHIL